MKELAALVDALRTFPGLLPKRDIGAPAAAFPHRPRCAFLPEDAGPIRNGDDAAAIPTGDGYTLLAAEGMLGAFVQRDPWFAGFSAVMVNINDILAMGGTPLAVVDVLFTGDAERDRAIMAGMAAAAERFGVPVVGGHTSRAGSGDSALAVAIVGRAKHLITSFHARPGDVLLTAVDLRGTYHGNKSYFDAASKAPGNRLRAQCTVLSTLAEAGLVHAGKDVSMAGFAGTLIMLCETSGVGANLHLEALPRPAGVELLRWLTSFPSFAFLLATKPDKVDEVCGRFARVGVHCDPVGDFEFGSKITLSMDEKAAVLWDHQEEPLTGFGESQRGEH